MSEMADAIRALSAEKGVSEDSIRQTIETAIKAAYRRTYGSSDNCIVIFKDDMSDVSVYSRKTIVDGVYDPSVEIELEEARELSADADIGDEIDILVDPRNFERSAVTTGKQLAHQGLSESFKDTLYKEYQGKINEIIIGYYQRSYKNNIYLDLGKTEGVEGVLPEKYQNPKETYEKNDRIKALIQEIKKTSSGIQLILSRSSPEFVKKILELEVPEISDGIVSIHKVVREAGYRTKVAVFADKPEIDPVGACVGIKGARIQNVIRELEGEKIDVLKYDDDPHEFIKNALSPAQVERVVITDYDSKSALAIVTEAQLSLAIGKSGQNVRLANRLCNWTIDVKTVEQTQDMDLEEVDVRKAAEQLFATETVEEEVVVDVIGQLPGIDEKVVAILKAQGLEDIQKCLEAIEDGSINKVEGITAEEIAAVQKIINDNVEFAEEEGNEEVSEEAVEEDSEFYCPECGAKIAYGVTVCPSCGIELAYEEEEEQE